MDPTAVTQATCEVETKILIPQTICKASGVVDLAFQEGSLFFIADWKMGRSDSVDNLQLLAYGSWACSEFGTAPDQRRNTSCCAASGARLTH